MNETPVQSVRVNLHRKQCVGFIASAIVLSAGLLSGSASEIEAVAFQAESGTLGASFKVAESGGVTYISNTNNNVGILSQSPLLPSRICTYNVTFPSVGVYELYARVRVGPGGINDDSFFYGNGFGSKVENAPADWLSVAGTDIRGFTNSTDLVTEGGTAGINIWKWMNVSQDTGGTGEAPLAFTVLGNLTQSIQIGGREDGFDIDKFVFAKLGSGLTVADLDAIPTPLMLDGLVSVSQVLDDGALTISYTGSPGNSYVAEAADNLALPVAWTAIQTNTADGAGMVVLTNPPSASQKFYRFRSASSAPVLPFVYSVENTGANFPAPPLPVMGNLPNVEPLTDPFQWSDGSGRSTSFADWKRRRAEIKAEIENYEIGPKPVVDPSKVAASYASTTATNGTLTVNITETNGQVLTLTCTVSLPLGAGPFPAVIGMNLPSGNIPSDIFTTRNIARITFSHNQVTTYGNPQNTNPYYRLYPALNIDNTGQYSAWAWGVSRIIDGLEKTQGNLPIDLKHIGVTGCSYAGKMALFAGAFDERIALTIAQESGGGGAAAWRVSETLGEVEKLGSTSHEWFSEPMFQFAGTNVSKLPMDHHELMAMVAPRALLCLGNPDYFWLADESGYVSCRAAHEVWKAFGISDRFGFSIVGGHAHCALPDSQRPEVAAYVEKFLKGNMSTNTFVTKSTISSADYTRWFQWWGTTNAVFPSPPSNAYTIALEAECGTVGTNWNVNSDAQASNGKYVTIKPGLQSLLSPPAGIDDLISIPFTLATNGNFAVFGRVNCPTADDDSFWIKMDNGPFVLRNGLRTAGWQWQILNSYTLTAGNHTLTIGYREDGAQLDKITISTYSEAPAGNGQAAENLCGP